MKIWIDFDDIGGGGGGGVGCGCVAIALIGIAIYVAITMWPKMFSELATGESGYNTAAYIVIIVLGLLPSIIVECVKKDADFGEKYLVNAIIIALLFLVGSILEGTFGLMTIIGAAIGGFIIALVPTAVFGLIGKAIRK